MNTQVFSNEQQWHGLNPRLYTDRRTSDGFSVNIKPDAIIHQSELAEALKGKYTPEDIDWIVKSIPTMGERELRDTPYVVEFGRRLGWVTGKTVLTIDLNDGHIQYVVFKDSAIDGYVEDNNASFYECVRAA